ncbi:hypothetical protein E2I00_002894, partial [Balaenoptera physalus]
VLGIRLALMAVWHCGLLLLPCHCPHSRWPSLTHVLFSHRQPWFYGWGFNLPRGQALLEKWNLIPEGVDVLVTHGPPLGYGVMADGTTTYVNASVCTVNYQPVNPPIVIDLPTPRNS